ncbi:MAG: PTS sugar transporter subunit IIA, partial [Pseudomonadota bacterium]
NAEARSKKHALEMLSELLADCEPPISPGTAFESLIARERLGSTALELGTAVPHGRVDGLDAATAAVVKLATPIDFDAPGDEPVSLLFGLLVPQECTDEHLADLAAIAAMLDDSEFRARLGEATTSRDLYTLIVEYQHRAQAGTG